VIPATKNQHVESFLSKNQMLHGVAENTRGLCGAAIQRAVREGAAGRAGARVCVPEAPPVPRGLCAQGLYVCIPEAPSFPKGLCARAGISRTPSMEQKVGHSCSPRSPSSSPCSPRLSPCCDLIVRFAELELSELRAKIKALEASLRAVEHDQPPPPYEAPSATPSKTHIKTVGGREKSACASWYLPLGSVCVIASCRRGFAMRRVRQFHVFPTLDHTLDKLNLFQHFRHGWSR
jgi:hypothetical protein